MPKLLPNEKCANFAAVARVVEYAADTDFDANSMGIISAYLDMLPEETENYIQQNALQIAREQVRLRVDGKDLPIAATRLTAKALEQLERELPNLDAGELSGVIKTAHGIVAHSEKLVAAQRTGDNLPMAVININIPIEADKSPLPVHPQADIVNISAIEQGGLQ